jgi:multiple sugar transport system ATP-binding protein
MPVVAGVTEELGSDINVLFSIDAPQVEHESIKHAVADDGDEGTLPIDGGKSLWTARVAARSKVRPGQPIDLAVNTSSLQFFDADSGLSIGHPETRAAETPAA